MHSACRWAQTFYETYPQIQGLIYPSSMAGGHNTIALNERALHALPPAPRIHYDLSDRKINRVLRKAAGWADPGLRSCAHWSNWKCGIGLNAAREKIRVAHALGDLPRISASFSKGEISYSKVRATTRVATPENEEFLLMIALYCTASHVERGVRQYRRAKRNEALEVENDRYERRRVTWRMDEDGCWSLHARFTPEQGERVMKAIDAAIGEIETEQENVSAETCVPAWDGKPMDDDLVVELLYQMGS